MVCHYLDGQGRARIKGGKDLKGSQAYPRWLLVLFGGPKHCLVDGSYIVQQIIDNCLGPVGFKSAMSSRHTHTYIHTHIYPREIHVHLQAQIYIHLYKLIVVYVILMYKYIYKNIHRHMQIQNAHMHTYTFMYTYTCM